MFLGVFIESVMFLGVFIESVVFLGIFIESVVFLGIFCPVIDLCCHVEDLALQFVRPRCRAGPRRG